jgi:uncharacterized DUF497 family protein
MFEWGEAKSEMNLRERGFDFAYTALIFEGLVLEWDGVRRDYGERRIRAIGQVEEDILFVVYTWRGSARRIIPARLANRRERDAYRQAFE